MYSGTTTCLICGATLSFHQSRTTKLCDNLQCRWKYSALRRDQLCAVCGRPLPRWQRADNVCSSPECQRSELIVRLRERCEQDRLKLEALRRQALQIRDQGSEAVGVAEP